VDGESVLAKWEQAQDFLDGLSFDGEGAYVRLMSSAAKSHSTRRRCLAERLTMWAQAAARCPASPRKEGWLDYEEDAVQDLERIQHREWQPDLVQPGMQVAPRLR